MRRPPVIARSLHKWLGLLVGVQVLVWLASGLYMVLLDIDFLHGDTLVRRTEQTVTVADSSLLSMADLRRRYEGVSQISLRPVMGKSFYAVTAADKRYLLDPETGEVISPLDEGHAKDIARFHFNGDAPVAGAELINSNPPQEILTRRLPLWRIDFDDRYSTSFYIDPYTGALVTRRHRYWRIFDFMWMLHIMDYEERADAHNPLLITAQVSGLAFALSGAWLLFYSFSGRRKRRPGDGP